MNYQLTMLKFAAFIFSTLMLFSCDQNKDTVQGSNFSDSTNIDTAAILNDPRNNLNIQTNSFSEIDSSGIIMFPLSMGENRRGKDSYSYKEIPSSSYWNIIFYNSQTSDYHLLSDKKILISSFDFDYGSGENVGIAFTRKNIFYRAIIDDFNGDKILNHEDPEYLFVSDKEGKNFRQISPTGYNLYSWKFIKSMNKVIMSATKDSDKNKTFDAEDEVSAFQIDIDKETQASEIFSPDFKRDLKLIFDKDWKRIKK